MTDLRSMSDEEFQQHRLDVQIEEERRENLVLIPEQIAELKQKYVDGGGNPDDLET